MNPTQESPLREINQYVRIPADDVHLLADLHVPMESSTLVILAHDGRCRNNPRSRHSARMFRERGIGTLVCDLLTDEEARQDETEPESTHDAHLLAKRLVAVTRWLARNPDTADLRIGYHGACAGGAAALIAASELGGKIGAVVVRGGRVDLASQVLPLVACPTLLIVGDHDAECMALNEAAYQQLRCEKQLKVIPGASHWFGEPGKLDAMTKVGAEWLKQHL